MIAKIRAGVFFGGPSVEHEVSVITAMQVLQALSADKYQPIPVYVAKDGTFYTGEGLSTLEHYRDIPAMLSKATPVLLTRQGKDAVLVPAKPRRFGKNPVWVLDVALPIFHGTGGEDGVMQAHFERLGLPYTGPDVTSSAIGMDKWASKALFQLNNLPCLKGICLRKSDYYRDPEQALLQLERELGYPTVIKPTNLGSSVGIHKCRERASLQEGLEDAFLYGMSVLAEPCVAHLREINCAVLGDQESARASVCEEPLNATDILTYADKYQSGGKSKSGGSKGMQSLSRQIPAPIPPELTQRIQQLAVDAFRAINASGCSRVDFLMDNETRQVWINEINTIPGSLAFYLWEASGLSFPALLEEMISLALKRTREQAMLHRSFDTNLLQTASLGGSKSGKKV